MFRTGPLVVLAYSEIASVRVYVRAGVSPGPGYPPW